MIRRTRIAFEGLRVSVEALAVALHHGAVVGTDKVVLLGVANHVGDGGAWPSLGTLASYANVSVRTVQRSLALLEKRGYIRVDRQAGGTKTTPEHLRPNRYEFLLGCPPTCDRSTNHRVAPLPQAPPQTCGWRG